MKGFQSDATHTHTHTHTHTEEPPPVACPRLLVEHIRRYFPNPNGAPPSANKDAPCGGQN